MMVGRSGVSSRSKFSPEPISSSCVCHHTFDTQITAEKRLGHIYVFDIHLNLIHLLVGLLGPHELAPSAKKRGGMIWTKLLNLSATMAELYVEQM